MVVVAEAADLLKIRYLNLLQIYSMLELVAVAAVVEYILLQVKKEGLMPVVAAEGIQAPVVPGVMAITLLAWVLTVEVPVVPD